jgi:hypothetical protein
LTDFFKAADHECASFWKNLLKGVNLMARGQT